MLLEHTTGKVVNVDGFQYETNFCHLSSSYLCFSLEGIVRLEQKNDTLLEMGIYDDGPFEAGDEREKNPELVPAPPNSYLGKKLTFHCDPSCSFKTEELVVVLWLCK